MKIFKIIVFLGIFSICPAKQTMECAFSPKMGSQELIIKTINTSKKSIEMATYSFTSKPIAEALLKAKNRGIKVRIVSDYKANCSKYSVKKFMDSVNIPMLLNKKYDILHHKFIIVDSLTLQIGSFNYSTGAYTDNAENVLVITNCSKDIVTSYLLQWDRMYKECLVENK